MSLRLFSLRYALISFGRLPARQNVPGHHLGRADLSTAVEPSTTESRETDVIISPIQLHGQHLQPDLVPRRIATSSPRLFRFTKQSDDALAAASQTQKASRKVTSTLKKLPSQERQQLFDKLRSEGKADVYHYSYMIGMCSSSMLAEKLLKEMIDTGVRPNIVSYNLVMRKLIEDGRFSHAQRMLYDLRRNGPAPDQHSYCTVINGLSKAGRHACAERVHTHLRQQGLALDAPSYNTAIAMFCRAGKRDRAEATLAEMAARAAAADGAGGGGSAPPPAGPGAAAYTILISAHGHAGAPDEALRLLADMERRGLAPDVTVLNAVVHALTVNGRLADAERIAHRRMGILLSNPLAATAPAPAPAAPDAAPADPDAAPAAVAAAGLAAPTQPHGDNSLPADLPAAVWRPTCRR